MTPEGPAEPHHALGPADLDDIAQALYGISAALSAHIRRSHRSGSQAAREVQWAIDQLTDIQGRLARGNPPA
jgi:hypothetical protein